MTDKRILRDTREKKGFWIFGGKRCKAAALKTGDYTLEGYEDILAIERKKSVSEISMNFTDKSGAFWREMERMTEIEHAYLIFEFTMEEVAGFPWKSKLPPYIKKKIRVRGGYLLAQIEKIEEMGIKVIFAGSRDSAISIAEKIFDEVSAGQQIRC